VQFTITAQTITRAVGTRPNVTVTRSCAVGATWRIRLKIVPWVRIVKKRSDPNYQDKTVIFCPVKLESPQKEVRLTIVQSPIASNFADHHRCVYK